MSIWGVNQSLPNPLIITAGADVACPAATETTVLSGSQTSTSPGVNVYIDSVVTCAIVLGATPPSAMTINAKLGGGADYDSFTVSPAILVANAVVSLSVNLMGSLGRGVLPGGTNISITVNPTGQAVTFKAQSRVVHSFGIGADA